MQVEYVMSEDCYEDYTLIEEPNVESEHGRYTPSMLEYYDTKFKQLSSYSHSSSSIIDIGCSAGVLMEQNSELVKYISGHIKWIKYH